MIVQLARAGEAMLHDIRPGAAPRIVTAKRGEGLPQITGWQHAELTAEPATRPAIIGDGDDGCQRVRHAPQRRQRRRQSVPATQSDDARGVPGRPDQAGAGIAQPEFIDIRRGRPIR
jgi:hypothetical protein